MTRVRRVPAGLFRRKRYEVEEVRRETGESLRRKITTEPVFILEKSVGTGDAWALIHAADRSWNGTTGEWASMPGPSADCP